MFKFRIGDEVLVTAGRDKGKKGKIEKVFPKIDKVTVENINIYKRHRKVSKSQAAGIYEISRPISCAKIAVICPKCTKVTRINFGYDGKNKQRLCVKCQGSLTT
ncbi:50S ribosomal protein L24 [Candidatus Curtissbacteria bacterium RIFCSPHIGHO2_12_FULL_38_9b]|uniref:Large ribosomal subunit protein uL24 n=2 Tax=Candidatus Curtissiibacteriota TaxID=1752717 RepID=A0A1F5GXG8_9BACT|nr:MAG: 50S ribosomal protein L24 [Candidatus Curtissbacteria bacterium RIFCSPLOWO2_01_FULL_37_9]OGD96538.1 MAG: 50S ribosomal protein L24 [Candidatus Curtissbacteria bacterium RIFCSPHIGHO2_12_FULL_38_9b]